MSNTSGWFSFNNSVWHLLILSALFLLPKNGKAQEIQEQSNQVALASHAWKTDTLGMKGVRAKMMGTGKIGPVIGKTIRELEELLGKPDIKEKQQGETYFIYFYESYLYNNPSEKSATQLKRELDEGKLGDVSLGSTIIYSFNRKGKLYAINFLIND